MTLTPNTILRISGIAGILGALLTASGDLLYHHIPGSARSIAGRMSALPLGRLVNAGMLGLLGAWFYFLALFHIYYAFLPVGATFALILSLIFALVMIAYGVDHASYFAIGSSAHVAAQHDLDVDAAGQTGAALFSRLVAITYIPVALASLLMLYGILSGRSTYPRWVVIFLPVIPYLLRVPILKILPGRARELIRDSYDNFVLLVFFIVSTLVLWKLN